MLTFVKVVRDVVTNSLGNGEVTPLCPERRSTGVPISSSGVIPAPRPGLLPGSWIGPTLLFAGVLNPGIPTTIPPRNAIAANTTSQVQGSQCPPAENGPEA